MNLSADEIDILFDAVEGYAPLWDARWECSRQKPTQADGEWIQQGKEAVRKLVESGLIFLHWDEQKHDYDQEHDLENVPNAIAQEQALVLLQQDEFWQVANEDKHLYFSATERGKELFYTSEQIKAYYRSEEFAFRYPAPKWHPMKQS